MGTEGCYVEILNPEISNILIETSVSCNINNIEVERFETYNLELINTDIVLPGAIGPIDVDQINGLNEYLLDHLDIGQSGTYLKLAFVQNGIAQFFGDGFDLDYYLDYYEFDGGTP